MGLVEDLILAYQRRDKLSAALSAHAVEARHLLLQASIAAAVTEAEAEAAVALLGLLEPRVAVAVVNLSMAVVAAVARATEVVEDLDGTDLSVLLRAVVQMDQPEYGLSELRFPGFPPLAVDWSVDESTTAAWRVASTEPRHSPNSSSSHVRQAV